jgi:hypothetical protein
MTHALDMDKGRKQEREERARQEKYEAQFAKDFAMMMADPGDRRVVGMFLRFSGLDASAFNPNAMTQSRAIGLQDAGRWWQDNIRTICPQMEPVLRIDLAKLDRQLAAPIDNEDQDDG